MLDAPIPFPPFLAELVEELYGSEIADGNADAMNDLGSLYCNGDRGFEQNYERAAHYYQMAADHGSGIARENLGYCYYYGRIGAPDYEKAFFCFAAGAFGGRLVSLYEIGDMYRNGLFVEKNEREAFCIFMHCIETMTPEEEHCVAGPVYLRLGQMLLDGAGTERDPKGALVCLQKAESYLYDMVAAGEGFYLPSMEQAVEGQAAARDVLKLRLDGSAQYAD